MAKENPAESQIAKTNAVLDRIKELKGLSGHGSETRLADILGKMDPATLYSWRQRGTLKISVLQEFLTPAEFFYATTGEKAQEVPPGTIGGSTWSQLPEERKAAAVERALAKGEAPLGMTQDEAIQRAYVILGEVKAAMPQLRELWTQREEGAFLAGVTRLLTAAQRSELADGLRNILVQIAKVAAAEGKKQKEDAG